MPASVLSLVEHKKYKALLLDQFGVLHDGRQPYPGAVETVTALAQRGLKLYVISNSSRRRDGALSKLHDMGFPRDAFLGAMTSGEVTHWALANRSDRIDSWKTFKKCIHFTWSARGAISLDDVNLEVTRDPEQADCIVAHGTEAIGMELACADRGKSIHDKESMREVPASLDDMKDLLLQCAAVAKRTNRPIPMIVANPDLVTVDGKNLRTMPGTLAKWYQAAGGEVHLMGKPARVIYDAALAELRYQIPNSQVLAIGDSLEHDVAGAKMAGIDAVFVAGGIHAHEFGLQGASRTPNNWEWNSNMDAKLADLCGNLNLSKESMHPDYIVPFFAS